MYLEAIVKITENEKLGSSCSARELHKFLEVGRDFTNWIKGRINKYGFEENADFIVTWNDAKTGDVVEFNGNVNSMVKQGFRTEYTLTLDMAKELSMVENNKKGREARKYFIECEKFIIQSNQLEEYTFFRQGGKGYRSLLMMTIEDYLPNIQDAKPIVTNLIYKNLFGKTAKEIRSERGIQEEELTRDYFSSEELYRIKKAEEYIRALIVAKDTEGLDQYEIMYAIEFQLKRVVINNR